MRSLLGFIIVIALLSCPVSAADEIQNYLESLTAEAADNPPVREFYIDECGVKRGAPPVLDPIGNQFTDELVELAFVAAASDPDFPPEVLTFSLDPGAPASATIHPLTGYFQWTPSEAEGPGVYPVTIRVTDEAPSLDDFETFNITVNEVNLAPTLDPIGNQFTDEMTEVTFTATATDPDIPVQNLTFSLTGSPPLGALISPITGVFSWTPTEAQGPGVYPVTVRVNDDGIPSEYDEETFNITVNEVNLAPTLDPIGNQFTDEMTEVTFTATTTDPDIPVQNLTFSLAGSPPLGALISPITGVFSWTPTEAQGPGVYPVTVRVNDDGIPSEYDEETFNITVNEVNLAPTLDPIGNQFTDEMTEVTFTATATDPDIPVQNLTFSLAGFPPVPALINPLTGVFSWTPGEVQGPGVYPVTVRVNDDGIPSEYDEETFNITVYEVNTAPALDPVGYQFVDELTELTFTATADDTDIPTQNLTFTLDVSAPAGASINPTTGIFSWIPTEVQGPGIYPVTVRVTDDGTPVMNDFEMIEVTVREVNQAPVLDPIGDQTGQTGVPVTLTATAADADILANTLTFTLDPGAPAGASIDPSTGAFTWTASATGTYPVTVRVSDDGIPVMDDFETFDILISDPPPIPAATPAGLILLLAGISGVIACARSRQRK